MVVATDRYVAEDVCDRIVVSYEELPVVVPASTPPARPPTRSTRTCPTTSPPGTTRRPATSRPRWPPRRTPSASPSTSSAAPACPWRARACTRSGTTTTPRCACTPPPGLHLGARGHRGQAAAVAGEGRGRRARRRRRVRPSRIVHPWPEELLVPMAAHRARPAGALGRGPPRALHLHWPTSASSARRSPSASTTRAGSPRSTSAAGTTTAPTRPYGIIVPIVTATSWSARTRSGYRVRIDSVYTNTSSSRPTAAPAGPGLLRHGADDGPDRRTSAWTAPRCAGANLIQPDQFPLRPTPDVPGRSAGHLRLRDYEGCSDKLHRPGRLGPRRGARAEAAARGMQLGIGMAHVRRGHRPALRGRPRAGCSVAARCWSPPA